MAHSTSQVADRVGPFVAGSTSDELTALAEQQDLALRLVDEEEQKRDYYRQRCEGLKATAKEFFYDYDEARSLVFQKTGDSEMLPDFIEYVYCWLADDRLAGVILFGVSSEAGNHEHIDQHEKAFWDQSAEIGLALSRKYTQSPEAIVNPFNFQSYTELPQLADVESESVFSSFEHLVSTPDGDPAHTRIDSHFCGPALVLASRSKVGHDGAGVAAHASQSARRIFCNDDWFVVYDHALERYVRTIESLHVFTSLVYLSRKEMNDVGRRLNARRVAQLAALARRKIDDWKSSLQRSEEAKQARIARLTNIL